MFDEGYFFEQLKALLDIDSTTGQFREIQNYLLRELERLGYAGSKVCRKGGVIVPFGGEKDPIAVTAHLDDIGLMVRKLNADGTLQVCPVGGLHPFYCMEMNVRLHTRDGRRYTGTICRSPSSVHVSEDELRKAAPDYRSNVCVVLDEPVRSAADVRALGVETGDMLALEPRFTRAGAYIKSHFLDDKACAALLLALMKELKEAGLSPAGRFTPTLPCTKRSATAPPGCRRTRPTSWPWTSRPPARTRLPMRRRFPSLPRTPASPTTGR